MTEKVCHAAALALVGWYLMIPLTRHPEAPISYWSHVGTIPQMTVLTLKTKSFREVGGAISMR